MSAAGSGDAAQAWRSLPRPLRVWAALAALIGIAVAALYVFGLLPVLDLTYYYLLIALFLPLAFLLPPPGSAASPALWPRLLPALVTAATALLLAAHGRALTGANWIPPNAWQFCLALALFLGVLEAARRAGGMVFLATVALFALYPVFAHRLPPLLWGPPVDLPRVLAFHVYSGDALLGVPMRILGEDLIGFLVLAALLRAAGASAFFLDLALALAGGIRGGPAKVCVFASAFFGSLSGSILANVASTGPVTIPAMKRAGFPAHYAGAVEACASTGGMLMPPVMGAVAFIMADFTGTAYATVLLAALIPCLLFYTGLWCHIHGYAARHALAGLAPHELPTLRVTLRRGWPFLVVLGFLLFGLLVMRWERRAPFHAAALLLALTAVRAGRDAAPRLLPGLLLETASLLAQTMALLLPAGFIMGGLLMTGVAPSLAAELIRLGDGNLALILAIGVGLCLLFGMLGMITASYLMLALTLAPALEQAGLNTLAVHLFIAWYATLAAITPPVGMAALLASRIGGADPMLTSWHAARLAGVLYLIPVFFLFQPALLLQGRLVDMVLWLPCALTAVVLTASAVEGWLPGLGRVRGLPRCLLLGAAPAIGFPGAGSTALGALLLTTAVALSGLASRRQRHVIEVEAR